MTGEHKPNPFFGEDAFTDDEVQEWFDNAASADNSATSVADLYVPEERLHGSHIEGDPTWFDD